MKRTFLLLLIMCCFFLAGCLPPGVQIGAPVSSDPFPETIPSPEITSQTSLPELTDPPHAAASPEPSLAVPSPSATAPAVTGSPEIDLPWEERNSYAGYSLKVPWPSGKETCSFLVITHTASMAERTACMNTVSQTLNELYGEEHVTVGFVHPETAEESVSALTRSVESAAGRMPGGLDAILLFPMEGADYADVLESAVLNEVPVWVFSSEMPAVIRKETFSLLSGEGMPSSLYADYEINLPWPKMDSGIRIGLISGRSGWYLDGYGFLTKSLQKGYGYGNYRIVPTYEEMGDSKQQFLYLIRYGREDGDPGHIPVDSILLFPSLGTDYTQELDLATQAGIPVWIFGGDDEDTIGREIGSLHAKPAATPGADKAGLAYPTAYSDHSLNCPWPSGKDPSLLQISRQEFTLYGTMVEGNCYAAVREGLREAYPNGVTVSYMDPENGLMSAIDVLSSVRFYDYDGILLFPYDDVDYSYVIEEAARKGVSIWAFSSVDPAVIRQEIADLVR